MELYSVYDAAGAFFRAVDEEQALTLLEKQAAFIDTKRRKPKFRLTVDISAARALLAPRFRVSQASRTFFIEHVGEERTPLYQHSRSCEGFGVLG